MKKIALVTGITGQDGAYLTDFLLKKNYIVHGVKRRASTVNNYRIDDLYNKFYLNAKKKRFFLHYGDVTDSLNISELITKILPDEIYNLAAQSHVKVSFETPEYTANADGLGVLRILETIRRLEKKKKIKFYQASTSELFGQIQEKRQSEKTKFYPKSPYASSKLFAYWITKNYRESYNMFACNGILFNHESPRRGETFVTKKIISALCKIKVGKQKKLFLGNINSKRDWGHAKDYVRAMWRILNHKQPDDFVIATNQQKTIKEFVNIVSKKLNFKLKWKGKGLNEHAIDQNNKTIIKIDKRYFRPLEVENLKGDYSKAKRILKWKPELSLTQLIDDMINFELKNNDK